MNIAIYSRKSKFTGKGESIGNQIEMCQDYIKLHYPNEQHIISVFEDEGFSGKNLNRPQFQKMISIEKSNPFDLIIVYRLDRISRNVGDFANLIEELNNFNTAFICIKEQFDTSTPMGRAMMNIAAVFAQLERETIAERIKDNMYMLAKEGHWTGGTTPLGYKSVKNDYISGSKSKSYYTLEIDKNQIDMVHTIFKKYKEIGSINGLETYLFENNIKTQKNNYWDKSNVKRVLQNPTYCIADSDSYEYFNKLGANVLFTPDECNGKDGILTYNRYAGAKKRALLDVNKWVITKSSHQGILTGKEWVEIQNLLESNSTNCFGGKPITRRTVNSNSILSGLLFCSKCGAYMRPKIYHSGNMFYRCENKDKGKCSNANVNGNKLEKAVIEEVFKFNVDNSLINTKFKQLQTNIDKNSDNITIKTAELEKRKNQTQSAIQNLIKSMSMGVSATVIPIINNQIEELTKQINEYDKQISDIQNNVLKQNDIERKFKETEDAIIFLKNNFNTLSVIEKRNYLKKCISKITWNGENENIDIYLDFDNE